MVPVGKDPLPEHRRRTAARLKAAAVAGLAVTAVGPPASAAADDGDLTDQQIQQALDQEQGQTAPEEDLNDPLVPAPPPPPDPGDDDASDSAPAPDSPPPPEPDAAEPSPPGAAGAAEPAASPGPEPGSPRAEAPAAPQPAEQAPPPAAAPATPPAPRPDQRHHRAGHAPTPTPPPARRPASQPQAMAAPPASAPAAPRRPAARPARTVASTPARPAAGLYTVRAGDSLWSIAAARLGPGAAPAAVAREVSRLWSANAHRVRSGSPSLIRPGERLVLD